MNAAGEFFHVRNWLLRGLLVAALAATAMSGISCVLVFRHVETKGVNLDAVGAANTPADVGSSEVVIDNPIKAHLASGETAIFRDGAVIRNDSLRGPARWYAFGSNTAEYTPVALAINDIAAVEGFHTRTDYGKSFVLSALASIPAAYAYAGLAVLIFGSCPTVYDVPTDGGEPVLQAELFPNSIAPLLETRDVDRLRVWPDADGVLRLAVRNEALETHYINHLELLQGEHAPGAYVVPQNDGRPIALVGFMDGGRAVDRTGRDVTSALSNRDEIAYETSDRVLSGASGSDFRDYIQYTVPLGERALDSAWVYLRLRNSLLSTVLFYDHMLASQGPRSVKWLADDLDVISNVVELGDYYRRNMGLRIEVFRNGQYEEVGRVREVGPIAFDEVAVRVPVPDPDSLRLRLRFIADAWRFDQLAVADGARPVDVTRVPLTTITSRDASPEWLDMVRAGVASSDTDYAITLPGEAFTVEYHVDKAPPGRERSYLLAMQGYYVEWIRGQWLRDNPAPREFVPSDSLLIAALRTWDQKKELFEKQFFDTRIPTSRD